MKVSVDLKRSDGAQSTIAFEWDDDEFWDGGTGTLAHVVGEAVAFDEMVARAGIVAEEKEPPSFPSGPTIGRNVLQTLTGMLWLIDRLVGWHVVRMDAMPVGYDGGLGGKRGVIY